jgi:hypothetical protein
MSAKGSLLKRVLPSKQQPWHHNVPELMDTGSLDVVLRVVCTNLSSASGDGLSKLTKQAT